jgi:hypothetical protein
MYFQLLASSILFPYVLGAAVILKENNILPRVVPTSTFRTTTASSIYTSTTIPTSTIHTTTTTSHSSMTITSLSTFQTSRSSSSSLFTTTGYTTLTCARPTSSALATISPTSSTNNTLTDSKFPIHLLNPSNIPSSGNRSDRNFLPSRLWYFCRCDLSYR